MADMMNIKRKTRVWVVLLRLVIMGIPILLVALFGWLFDNTENILCWLDKKLPDPQIYNVAANNDNSDI